METSKQANKSTAYVLIPPNKPLTRELSPDVPFLQMDLPPSPHTYYSSTIRSVGIVARYVLIDLDALDGGCIVVSCTA